MKRRIATALTLLLLLPGLAQAWWNESWAYRKKITLNTSASGADTHEALSDFPVLVRLHTGNFTFLEAREDGGDLRLVAGDDKTPLKYHIEQWDPINELALVWVHVPRVAPGSIKECFWLYFGNPKAEREEDIKATYDATTALVLHFNAKSDKVVDASPGARAVAATGVTPLAQGPIDGAVSFNGSSELRVGGLDLSSGGLTFSAWVRVAEPQKDATLFALGRGAQSFLVGMNGLKVYARAEAVRVDSAADLTANSWHQVAATLGEGKLTLFIDGKPAGQVPATAAIPQGDAVSGTGLRGDLDEVVVSASARTADWIKAAWAAQSLEAKLAAAGQDEQAAGGGHSYFRILLGAVTVDGWVVIGILMVMMLMSFVVMLGKALLVARTSQSNRDFLEHFQKNPNAMLDPAHVQRPSGTQPSSSLFRLYYLGLRELAHRFDQYEGEGKPRLLSPQALGAIKASLDAGMVREQARLNNQMVLLTIAISGGPFLGLLGTVVGVMITFAAIAAVGDVNVNSIAPGIAAALVATVAGLGVAIPALFGYNYLASRIKNLSNDMTVFADELVTRMAERYAP
jgi:biopolymer transport protein ExbB